MKSLTAFSIFKHFKPRQMLLPKWNIRNVTNVKKNLQVAGAAASNSLLGEETLT
jgi:hypothetical protein